MSLFDRAYDEMSWKEICYRLPGDLAIRALQRRITNLDTLRMFFDNVGKQPANVKELKSHVNSIITNAKIDDIFTTFDQPYHVVLFNWLEKDNIDRFRAEAKDKLDIKFLFNVTDSKDEETLTTIMDKVLTEPELEQSKLRAVLRKADDVCLPPLIDKVLQDPRPEVRACILCVPGLTNKEFISDHQKVIGLKAFAKCPSDHPIDHINILNIGVFNSLRPEERMIALDRYLSYFPLYRKIKAFDPAPSDEEFEIILFAGCIEQNERVLRIKEMYNQITKEDPPKEDESDEDDTP